MEKNIKKKRICAYCKKDVPEKYRSDAKCCSARCSNSYRAALRIGRIRRNGDRDEKYKGNIYRQVILSWYDFECQICGKIDKYGLDLVVHHKIALENGGLNHWSNVIVLCRMCHVLIHKSEGVYL